MRISSVIHTKQKKIWLKWNVQVVSRGYQGIGSLGSLDEIAIAVARASSPQSSGLKKGCIAVQKVLSLMFEGSAWRERVTCRS